MTVNVCCVHYCYRSPRPPPIQPPPVLTPAPEELPSLPNFNLDGAFCIPLRTSSRPSTGAAAADPPPADPLPDAALSENIPQSLSTVVEESIRQEVSHPLKAQEHLSPSISTVTIPQVRRKSAFTNPGFGMVNGRTPREAWAAVAAKVVAANRFRLGLSKDVKIRDFKIEELGDQLGPLVFGPVSVFNGKVTLFVTKPLKRATVTITFSGATKLDKYPIPFYTVTHELFVGDLQQGLRTFLFGFNFPYVNLPPTSDNPIISYTFQARLALEAPPDYLSQQSQSSGKGDIVEYRSKNLHVFFIPAIDSNLEMPLRARQPSMKRRKSKERNVSITPITNTHTLPLSSDSSSAVTPAGGAKLQKPKLTLTTADLTAPGSSNSTPVIDKPNPAIMSSRIVRTTRITDDENNTLARLRIELPKSRFLPGEEIAAKVFLQVKEGVSFPKGFGARVIETRYLAIENKETGEGDAAEGSRDDDDSEQEPRKMKPLGKEQFKVLTGKKFVIRTDDATLIEPGTLPDQERKSKRNEEGETDQVHNDAGLEGGKELMCPLKVSLPAFKTFISDSLLPTSSLPLGDPRDPTNSLDDYMSQTQSPATSASRGKSTPHDIANGKGKRPTASTSVTNLGVSHNTAEMYFVVSHTLQVTVPAVASSWLRRPASAGLAAVGDLEVMVPIILGNKDLRSRSISSYRAPEVRLNAPDAKDKGFNSDMSSFSSSRSISRSISGSDTGAESSHGSWRAGQRFLTMRETSARPKFIEDF